jgi:hypothetical protein
MRTRPVATALVGAALALTALAGLAACSAPASSVDSAAASAVDISGTPVTAKDDMTALCAQMIEQALPEEAAVALAEASGYTTRVGKIDGEDQALTMDLREDRFTLEITDGAVTGCTIG